MTAALHSETPPPGTPTPTGPTNPGPTPTGPAPTGPGRTTDSLPGLDPIVRSHTQARQGRAKAVAS